MITVEKILSNIKSIGYFLASKKDILANADFHTKIEQDGGELVADIVDLKLSDLQYNLDTLNEIFKQMKPSAIQKIKICIASSHSLKEEREEIETFLFRENDTLVDDGIYLYYNVWEKQSLRFNNTYKQEDFNEALVNESDIFICLIGDAVGKFTKEEFDKAKERFTKGEKPFVFYVYFKDFEGKPTHFYESQDWKNRIELKDYIFSKLNQCAGTFKNSSDLIRRIDASLKEDIEIVKKKTSTP